MNALVDWHRVHGRDVPPSRPHERAWNHAAELDLQVVTNRGSSKSDVRDAWRVAADAAEEAGDRFARTQCLYNVARFNEGRLGPGEHVHRCSSCFKVKPCAHECSIVEDQELADGTIAGSIIECSDCVSVKPAVEAWNHAASVKTTEAWLAAARAIEAWGKDPLSADHARWLAFAAPGECYACARTRSEFGARLKYAHTCAKRATPPISEGGR